MPSQAELEKEEKAAIQIYKNISIILHFSGTFFSKQVFNYYNV